jgi:hypothetical protein
MKHSKSLFGRKCLAKSVNGRNDMGIEADADIGQKGPAVAEGDIERLDGRIQKAPDGLCG